MFKRNLKWQIKSTTNFIFFHRCSPRDKPFYSPIDLVHIQANIYMTIVTNGILMSCCPSCFTLLIPGWCEPWTGTCTLISQVCAGVCRCVCVPSHTCALSFTGACVCRCRWTFVCRVQDNSANISQVLSTVFVCTLFGDRIPHLPSQD